MNFGSGGKDYTSSFLRGKCQKEYENALRDSKDPAELGISVDKEGRPYYKSRRGDLGNVLGATSAKRSDDSLKRDGAEVVESWTEADITI